MFVSPSYNEHISLSRTQEHIQRIARGSMSRRITAPLKQQHLLTLQQLEAERINNIRRQEEALRESIRREEIKNQTKERDLMGVNEAQCRKIWDEIKKRAESQRLAEFQRMSIEDAHAALIRQMVLQAKAKLQSYALLAAQEDEYYGLDDSGSDASDTESEAELEMEIPDTPPEVSNMSHSEAAKLKASRLAAKSSAITS